MIPHTISISMTNRRLFDCVYIDFKRAFDVVCHRMFRRWKLHWMSYVYMYMPMT